MDGRTHLVLGLRGGEGELGQARDGVAEEETVGWEKDGWMDECAASENI